MDATWQMAETVSLRIAVHYFFMTIKPDKTKEAFM